MEVWFFVVFYLAWNVQEQGTVSAIKTSSKDAHNMDIVFVVDKSGSIGREHFESVKDFIEMFVEYFPVFPAKTRVAIVSYSTYVRLEFDFNEFKNKECLRDGIRKMRYTNGRTSTGNALEFVRTNLIFNHEKGARKNVSKMIFVITDGRTNLGINPVIPARKLMQHSDLTIFALGVTNKINETELQAITGASQDAVYTHIEDFAALKNLTQSLNKGLSKKCVDGATVFDQCGRRCKCTNGKLVDCCRLRKEFTQLTQEERIRYINTVIEASMHPEYRIKYEQLLTLHMELFRTAIHAKDFFLPWHRWFILEFENLLQRIDCRVTVPYWAWTRDAAMPFASDFWNPGAHGFGGNGAPPGGCVKTGPFREGEFFLTPAAGGGCLKRNFNGRFPDAIALASLLASNPNAEDFTKFEAQLRVVFHNEVYCNIHGTMCTRHAGSAPEFFLHHTFIDKVWNDWQNQGKEHKFNTFFESQTEEMPASRRLAKEFLDLNDQPDCVCVEYVERHDNVSEKIKSLTLSELQNIPRLEPRSLSNNATELFPTEREELEDVIMLQANIAPKQILSKSSLNGTDARLGFRISDVFQASSTANNTTGKLVT